MGYCMEQMENKFCIRKENEEKALQALKELARKNKKLAWINSNTIIKANTLEDAINECGWELERDDEESDYNAIYFISEKLGDENIFFSAIAPYVESGSYIQMVGEDGCIWRYVFENGEMKEVEAKISF